MNLTELSPTIGNLNRLKRLKLGNWNKKESEWNQLKVLPEELWHLQQLEELDLSNNQFNVLPESITQLTNLTYLDLSHNQFNVLPVPITQLTKLTYLDLSYNQFNTLPESIGKLTNLTTFRLSDNFRHNQFNILPESITQLTKLTYLDLSYNQFNILPESITQLTNLTYLDFRHNQLKVLPESIGQLANLTSLHLRHNQLNALPESIGKLINLTSLDFWNNQLNSLPGTIGKLTNIISLDLSRNQLNTLPDSIGQLTNLKDLHLSYNQLNYLPESIGKLTNLTSLMIGENSLIYIPPEVVEKGGIAVRDYYRQRLEENTDYIYEAKLLIIGEGGAGKTSLANKLINREYRLKLEGTDNPEKSTEGIDVFRFDFSHSSGNSFRINIWDFGGQEIYHATHQFFLTKRSLYLLVADTRQDNTDFNYWLEVVELLSEDSPAIIVKNEKQDRPCQVNENQLRGRFSNLEKILPTNLASNRGLSEILSAIKHHISQLPHIGQPLPKTWVRVRAALEADNRNYISQDDFLDLCDNNGFKRRADKLQLSDYLHDLGVCLHFQDDPILKNWIILKPEWGTTAVYKIFDAPKVQQAFGCFTHNDLAEIWADDQYTDMRDELLQLMMRFKLCYEIPHRPHTYISPQLLSPNQPDYSWEDTDNLMLRYHYDFMPKGILTRFAVEMHKLIDNDLIWKNGIILIDNNTRAEIIEVYYKNEIRIRVSSFLKKDLLTRTSMPELLKKDLLIRIRHEFQKIHDSYKRLSYKEFIPCNCRDCKDSEQPTYFDLGDLQARLMNKRNEIECNKNYKMINVRSLIDDVIGDSRTSRSTPDEFPKGLDRVRRKPIPSVTPVIINNNTYNNNQTEQLMNNDNTWTGDRISGDKVMGNKVRTGDVAGDVIAGNKIVNTQNMTQTAQDIKVLVNQYVSNYDTTTQSGKMGLSCKVLESIEKNPTLKSRTINALKEAGKTAFEEAIDHPVAKVLVAGLEGFIE